MLRADGEVSLVLTRTDVFGMVPKKGVRGVFRIARLCAAFRNHLPLNSQIGSIENLQQYWKRQTLHSVAVLGLLINARISDHVLYSSL